MNAPAIETGPDKLARIGSALSRVIEHGERAVPRGHGTLADDGAATLVEIEACRSLSIEGGNPLGDEADLLLMALERRFRARDNVRRAKWEMIAYALLMLVKDQLRDVLEQRRQLLNPGRGE